MKFLAKSIKKFIASLLNQKIKDYLKNLKKNTPHSRPTYELENT